MDKTVKELLCLLTSVTFYLPFRDLLCNVNLVTTKIHSQFITLLVGLKLAFQQNKAPFRRILPDPDIKYYFVNVESIV